MNIGRILLISGCLLASGLTVSAQPTCSLATLGGLYEGNSIGWAPSTLVNPTAPATLLPFACISQVRFGVNGMGGTGQGTGIMFCNIAGNAMAINVTITSTTVNEDCTGEITWTQMGMPAKAKLMVAPSGNDFRWVAMGGGVWSAKVERVSHHW